MEEFTTAEGVTRFLRAKTSSPENAVATARKLIAGKFALYLPNLAFFVFDLICDRVSELSGKNFFLWRFHPELWLLWQDVWNVLGKQQVDRELRARSFRKAKFVQVVSVVLGEVSGRLNTEQTLSADSGTLLANVFLCIDTFLAEGYIDVDEMHAMDLLKNYCTLLLTMDASSMLEVPIDAWTGHIKRIYELPQQAIAYKPSKKSMARYFTEVLPVHLALFGTHRSKLPTETHRVFHLVFSSILFEHERSNLPCNIGSLMASPAEALDEAGVLFLFHAVITNLASVDIAACESVYMKLTTGKFAHMAEELINVLSQVNKTVSTSFFLQLYAKEVTAPVANWRLISHLLKLDPELTLARWKDVVHGSAREPLLSLTLVADNVSLGFVRARDLPFFAGEVYPFALTVSDGWASPRILAKLAPKVNEMSGNQIARLCKQFLALRSHFPLSLLLQGLLFCSLQKQKASRYLFEEYSFCHTGWAEIAYYVVCIYGESITTSQPELLNKVSGTNTLVAAGKMDLYLAFRMAELTGDTAHINTKQMTSYIRSMSKEDILPFAKRWIVLMGSVPGAYHGWFKRAFKVLDTHTITEYIQSHQALLCELLSFLSELSMHLQKSRPPCLYEVLSVFPPLVFRKFFGQFMPQMCEDAPKQPENISIRSTLRHVLQKPVFSSDFEKNFDLLREFVQTSTDKTLTDTLAVATSIWSAHINNIRGPQSKKYVENAVYTLRTSLENPLKADLLLSQVVLSMKAAKTLDHFEAFLEKYVAVKCSTITTGNIEHQLKALTELPELTAGAKTTIKNTVRTFGGEPFSAQCKVQLFCLVAKTSNPNDVYFVVALFLSLCQCETAESSQNLFREILISNLKMYLKTLPAGDYTDLFALCIKDLRDAVPEYVPLLVDTCTVLSLFVSKEHDLPHTKLLIAFILAFAERYTAIHAAETVTFFAHTIAGLLAEKPWVFKQYSVELVLSTAHMLTCQLDYGPDDEKVYLSAVKLVSHVVLFHRSRFRSRHHLVVMVFSGMMMPLCNIGVLRGSEACASAYTRLLISLCEPQIYASSRDSDVLTSRAVVFKKALRKHAHILLVNYIYIRLHHRFSGDVNDKMMPGIYSLFSLLSASELLLVNTCLDASGRAFYQTLYSTYKDQGKWKE